MNFLLSLTWLHAWVCMVPERGFQSVHVWAHWYPAEPAWDTLPLPLTPLPPSEPISLMLHSGTVVQPSFQLGSVLFSWQEEAGRVFPDQVRLGFAGCQIYLGLRTRHYRTKHSCRRHTAFWGEVLIQPCSSVTTVCAPVCLCKDLMLDAFSYLSADSSKQNKTLWQFKKASKNITENGAFKSTKFKLFLCKRKAEALWVFGSLTFFSLAEIHALTIETQRSILAPDLKTPHIHMNIWIWISLWYFKVMTLFLHFSN